MSFSKSFIDELKARNPIHDVVSRYVDLKRAGSNYKANCPFHSERTPSFVVFANDSYHCFGCGAGGDVITFIMQIENLDYPDAIRFLADRAGLDIPDDTVYYETKKQVLSRERNFALNVAAAKIFHNNLLLPEAKQAREYLEKRRLTMPIIKHFGIGFAFDDFSRTTSELKKLGFTYEEMKEAFICGISKNGNYYDYFRNRIIFPIIDTSGKVVAFGGRILDNSQPKYLNSSDTPVFKKSKTLYAFNFAKNVASGSVDETNPGNYAKAGELILCEGYMDVIALHKAGFSNSVATLGTAITSEHARMMARVAKTVYISYDSDNAGKAAADRALKMLYDAGIEAKVIKINGAKDPDEFINNFGAASFAKLLGSSSGQTDYKINNIIGKYNLSNPDEKLKAIGEACAELSLVFPEYKREVFVIRLSEITGVAKETLLAEIKRKSSLNKRQANKKLVEQSQNNFRHIGDKINKDAARFSKECIIEERILGILLLHDEYIEKIPQDTQKLFATEFNKSLLIRLKELYMEGKNDFAYLNEFYTPEEVGRISSVLEARKALSNNSLEIVLQDIETLRDLQLAHANANQADSEQKDSNDSFLAQMEFLRNKKLNKDNK